MIGHRFYEPDRWCPDPSHVQSGHSTPVIFMMDLRLANLNGHGLGSDSGRSHLLLYLRRRSIDICCLQETRFDSNFHEDSIESFAADYILSKDYLAFSGYFDGRSRGVTWLISKCPFVLSDLARRLCVLDVTIKDKAFRLIGVIGPNGNSELPVLDVTIKDKAFRLIGVIGPNGNGELPVFFRRIEL